MSARYEYEDVWLPKLALNTTVLEDYVFYRCRLYGAAVLWISEGCVFEDNFTTHPTPHGLYFAFQPGLVPTSGQIKLEKSVVENCWFDRVGFAYRGERRNEAPILTLRTPDPGPRGFHQTHES